MISDIELLVIGCGEVLWRKTVFQIRVRKNITSQFRPDRFLETCQVLTELNLLQALRTYGIARAGLLTMLVTAWWRHRPQCVTPELTLTEYCSF